MLRTVLTSLIYAGRRLTASLETHAREVSDEYENAMQVGTRRAFAVILMAIATLARDFPALHHQTSRTLERQLAELATRLWTNTLSPGEVV